MRGMGQATNVLIGYLEGVAQRDADAYARAFARRSLRESEVLWYATAPLWSGYLYEVQEGGPGRSFLPDLVREIDAHPGGVALVPSGVRVFELTVRNGRPVGGLLPEAKSREVRVHMSAMLPMAPTDGRPFGLMIPAWVTSDQVRCRALRPTRRMKRLREAMPVSLAVSVATFAVGTVLLIGGTISYFGVRPPLETARAGTFDTLPHRQWSRVMGAIATGGYAVKLEFRDGKWTIETEPK